MSATTIYTHPSAMETSNGNSGDIDVSNYTEIAVDVNVSAKQGTSPTLQILIYRKDAFGNYFQLWDSTATSVNSPPVQIFKSIGPGCTVTEELGSTIRMNWNIGGSATPGAQFTASIIAK